MAAELAAVAYVDGSYSSTMTDPQQILDFLAEHFPDLGPTPAKPKVGDRVRVTAWESTEGTIPVVAAIAGDWAWLTFDGDDPSKEPHSYRLAKLTVIERGES